MRNLIKINLNLFNESGANAAAGTVSTNTSTPENVNQNTNNTVTSNKRNKKANSLADVVYGKQEIQQELQQDKDNNEIQKVDKDVSKDKPKSFEELIKNDYKEDFENRVQSIINDRFKKYSNLQENYDKANQVLSKLGERYGVDSNDFEKLIKIIDEDESYLKAESVKRGLTLEQTKNMLKSESEIASFQKIKALEEEQKKAQEFNQKLINEAQELKKIYPEFDLDKEIQNPQFLKVLKNTDLKTAYQAVHFDDILGNSMAKTAAVVEEKTVNKIKSNSERPRENGIGNSVGTIFKNDVTKLNKLDRKEIARRAKLGQKVEF